MRRRMAAKIAPMKMPPQRIALVAILVLLLVAAGVWQLQASHVTPSTGGVPPREVDASPRATESNTGNEVASEDEMRSASEPCEQALRQQRRVRMEHLAKQNGVDSQIAHALLATTVGLHDVSDEPDSTLALLAGATHAAPGDVEAAWYYARYCADDVNCDADAAVARLLALEQDNLDGWLLALQLATKRNDEAGVATALENGAKSGYFDQRTGDGFIRVVRALEGLPLPPACATPQYLSAVEESMRLGRKLRAEDLAMMQGVMVEISKIRAYTPLRDACAAAQIERFGELRGKACRSVMTQLSNGDLLIDRIIGEMSMVELTADTGQGASWRERLRKTHWMMAQMRSLEPDFETGMRRFSEGEMTALQSELEASGGSVPPTDWLPDNERARSLVLTGRVPVETKPK